MSYLEPDMIPEEWIQYRQRNGSLITQFKEEWKEKSLKDCILNGDNECKIRNGTKWDSSIVSRVNIFINHHIDCYLIK